MKMRQLSPYKENFSSDFSVEHKVTVHNEKSNLHIHDVFEILLVLSDGIQCTVQNKTYRLHPNTLLLFNNMDLHYLSMLPGSRLNDRYVLFFKPEYIEPLSSSSTNLLECFFYRPFEDPNLLPLPDKEAHDILDLMNQLNYYQRENNAFGRELLVKFLLGQLLIYINRLYRKGHHIPSDVGAITYSRIYRIMQYIHKNYAEKLSLDFLASRFYIDKSYMCALFKKVTGITPMRYLINCRIMKAKELLLRNYSVDDVCGMVGFNHLTHFSHSFKQHTGKSPKQFQMSMEKEK